MNRTIRVDDIESVCLKMDFDKNLRYIEIKSSGLSVNATFSPSDPAKVMQLLEA